MTGRMKCLKMNELQNIRRVCDGNSHPKRPKRVSGAQVLVDSLSVPHVEHQICPRMWRTAIVLDLLPLIVGI